MTPQQQAVLACDIQRQCLLEAGNDVEVGIAAAEYIFAHGLDAVLTGSGAPPGTPDSLSAFFAFKTFIVSP